MLKVSSLKKDLFSLKYCMYLLGGLGVLICFCDIVPIHIEHISRAIHGFSRLLLVLCLFLLLWRVEGHHNF